MGKRILVQRRGKGGKQFQANSIGKIAPVGYPFYPDGEEHVGEVVDIVHETGRAAPLARIRLDDGRYCYIPALQGMYVGAKIHFNSKPQPLTVKSLGEIPDGTTVCLVERNLGDGGKLVRSAGSSAIVFSHSGNTVTLRMPSGRFITLDAKCRGMIGSIAGGGRLEKPFLKAGAKWYAMRARSKKWPIVRGVAMAAPFHPHGGGRHQHPGKQTSVARDAPPGRKVGHIAPRKTGRGRVKREA
ncbi:MAG: 50S ribosomal protein L2 [Candidatus Nitrosocaldus sp.]